MKKGYSFTGIIIFLLSLPTSCSNWISRFGILKVFNILSAFHHVNVHTKHVFSHWHRSLCTLHFSPRQVPFYPNPVILAQMDSAAILTTQSIRRKDLMLAPMRILYIPLFVPKLEKAHQTTVARWEDDILKPGCCYAHCSA